MMRYLDHGVDSDGSYQTNNGTATHFTHRSDVRTQVTGGEVVLLDEREGRIHQLNRTASFIWRACDGHTCVDDIIRLVTEDFDVQQAAAAADVADVIERLHGLGLLCR